MPTETLIADFEAGLNSVQMAEKHGMGEETVRWRLNNWKPGCFGTRPRQAPVRRDRSDREDKTSQKVVVGPTYVNADDGQTYECGLLWLRDWACVSFNCGVVEVLVLNDGGNPRRAINATQCPVVLGKPLVGVRVFPDRHGVQRTWKAYEARPKAQGQRFPRRLIPKSQEPTSQTNGAVLYVGSHS